jgi:hypothetical protein
MKEDLARGGKEWRQKKPKEAPSSEIKAGEVPA